MYGDNDGYGFQLVDGATLTGKVAHMRKLVEFAPGDLIIDIGSNDGTSLAAYCDSPDTVTLVGCDPTAKKFQQYSMIIAARLVASEMQAIMRRI